MFTEEIIYALLLTLGAGMATVIGGLLPFFAPRGARWILPFSLGLSAGVMIYISFMELLREAQDILIAEWGDVRGGIYATLALFGGIAIVGLIDILIPSEENPHHVREMENLTEHKSTPQQAETPNNKGLKRVGVVTALAIAVHNFPEGIATFVTALEQPTLGLTIAIAVAIHNIPEGIAVAIPIYYATRSRGKALLYTFISGVAEPAGAILAMIILAPYITSTLMAVMLAAVAGFMIFISIDELLPSARVYGQPHTSIIGFVVGMLIMATSLILI
ncbi:MAG: zinc transporter ZupT [Rikenellaceae bacterium]